MTPTQALELRLHRRPAAQQLRLHPRRLPQLRTDRSSSRSPKPATSTTRRPASRTVPLASRTPVPLRTEPAPGPRPTLEPCSDTATNRAPVHTLTKSLTRARWGLRVQTTRMAELHAELARREARAAEFRAEVASTTEQLEEAQPGALSCLHDVSGGAR